MSNPFDLIDARLINIESLVLDLKHNPIEQDNSVSTYKPIANFCEEMGMTRANLYNLDRKGIIKLKKLGGKTFVDVDQVKEAMRDFRSKVEEKKSR